MDTKSAAGQIQVPVLKTPTRVDARFSNGSNRNRSAQQEVWPRVAPISLAHKAMNRDRPGRQKVAPSSLEVR